MKLTLCIACVAAGGLWLRQDGKQDMVKPTTQEAFALAELVEQSRTSQRPYVPFLDRDSMSCGVYRLAAGERDGQGPHQLDEVYYVVEGKARLMAGADTFPAEAGSIFFVQRGVEHRFVDIEEDLVVVVFFSKELPEEEER